jgi:hypothetical protein
MIHLIIRILKKKFDYAVILFCISKMLQISNLRRVVNISPSFTIFSPSFVCKFWHFSQNFVFFSPSFDIFFTKYRYKNKIKSRLDEKMSKLGEKYWSLLKKLFKLRGCYICRWENLKSITVTITTRLAVIVFCF